MAILFETDDIVVLSSENSKNAKTGNMVQTWYLLRDVAPHEAFKAAKGVTDGSAAQSKVCGACPHLVDGSCYVLWFHAPRSTWAKYHRGGHAKECPTKAVKNKFVRFGSAGNPTIIPFEVTQKIARKTIGWTGYTHEWLTCDQQYSQLFMASCDSKEEAKAAQALGWRTFRVRPVGDTELLPGEIVCPATQTKWDGTPKTDCETCGLCSGTSGRGKCSVVVDAHGKSKNKIK